MRLFFLLLLSTFSSAVRGQGANNLTTCGADTYLDNLYNECRCSNFPVDEVDDDLTKIYLAGIFDTTAYDWGPDIFEVTVKLINEGWYDILQPETGERLEYSLENSQCDETLAARSYWKLRTENGNKPMHGIVGARCSGASITLARISGLEGVPQLSPTSNSAQLSNNNEFPFFSRLVAPNDERGEVGALIAMLRAFGWERITILATDTQFAKDLVTEFRKSWVGDHQDDSGDWFGEVAYSDTIRITPDGVVDEDSVQQALSGVPTDEPTINSRIILLVAHNQHAFRILETATRQSFQRDTIWVGPSSWAGREAAEGLPALPSLPGYLGIAPFRNRDERYNNLLKELQEWQRSQGRQAITELPAFAAETVDAVVALTKAIKSSPQRRDGESIVRNLRQLDFDGVSGRVQFTTIGDRKDPQYSIFNAKSTAIDGTVIWDEIGTSGTEVGTAALTVGIENVCFAEAGCGLSSAPDDTYPVPKDRLPIWVIIIILVIALLFVGVAFKYWRSSKSKQRIKRELKAFRDSVVGMRAAGCDYIPKVVKKEDEDCDVEQAFDLSPIVTAQWCWKETDVMMGQHNASDIHGNPADCWIKYDKDSNEKLEKAFQDGKTKFSPLPGYSVSFADMEQTKVTTGFTRKVQRVVQKPITQDDNDKSKELDLGKVQIGGALPDELAGEPQMVLVMGDVVQISKQRSDGWAFGTKLHFADEARARDLVVVATGAEEKADDEVNVLTDTGWFQLDTTRVPTVDDLAALQRNVGDTGALDPPSHWDPVQDPTVVQQHELRAGDSEREAVVDSFMSTLRPPHFDKNVRVVKVERIQNLAMWQSYVVKRQTICYRETGHTADNDDDDIQLKALQRFERKWLFHGSNQEVLDKILQQGFNRSFCGKNATAYGKGVYFARDASYSAYPIYAVPDRKGQQYMLACRVVVGEYCRGKHDALTPDVRDPATQSLYDSTIGTSSDSMSDPSIFVTYHDAQAYPEYLITFKTS